MQQNSRYRTRIATSGDDIRAAQRLRCLAFAGGGSGRGFDADAYDVVCTHIMIEETATDQLVCCFRMLPLISGAKIAQSYSAQFYELSALAAFNDPIVELGRFCIHPKVKDPDIVRMAWAEITRYVDENKVKMLFGCSSFKGTDARRYLDVFAMLKHKYLAPKLWLPKVKAKKIFRFDDVASYHKSDFKRAMTQIPPLLRTYLSLGGWVSDHAVVDPQMDTLHVFTGLEINAIPAARKRILRAAVA